MPDDDLTPVQGSVLLILMAEAREIANAHLTNFYKLKLERKLRDDLEQRRWIRVRRDGRLLFLELIDGGFRWCREQDGAEVPRGAGHGTAAAYAIVAGLHRNLGRLDHGDLPDLFTRLDETGPGTAPVPVPAIFDAMVPADIEARIRKSYQELATGPGAWVKLADLRPLLGTAARPDVDRVLVGMNRTADVSIVPESNQKALSEQDRAAAVRIGNQDKHLISIGPS